ncbi:MAG: radical SAM protein [Erysipelotrichaceae bacterium]|nr:radical SAM protein [Erysipelotrichaceae bacterium]
MKLSLCVDMYGCPNRCKHCWLGHMPNRNMEEGSDEMIMDFFSPYFEEIDFYSWLREPDYCDHYEGRWKRDIGVSKNTIPERFELASFWRIVRDENYIPFLKKTGVKKVQLTLFGTGDIQDFYVGRKGAYREVLKATDLLIEGGIIPRWQCFINEENKEEIVKILHLYEEYKKKCPEMEFFVHEGTCDGENEKLYPVRIEKDDIPKELIPYYLEYESVLTERECVELLKEEDSHPSFCFEDDPVLYISNTYDVFFNFTHMKKEWKIGNLREDTSEEIMRRITEGDTYALRSAKDVTWKKLVQMYGDPDSEKVFRLDDYKMYLFNSYLEGGK